MNLIKTLTITFIIFFSSSTYAAFILEGGYEIHNFSPTTFNESITTDEDRVQIQFTFANSFDLGGLEDSHLYNGHLELNESIQIDFYENHGDINPFATHVIDGQDPETHAYIFLWQDFLGSGDAFIPWLDLEGSIIISSISGEVEILQPSLLIINNDNEYTGNASVSPVPLPPSFQLLFMSLVPLFLFRKKPNKSFKFDIPKPHMH
ncbi:MAG: hypothetical protein DIZ80_11765 [endosymbiont of Galathealinum brachiosum]|uniref:Uncharacterized protein n=1 Tax=endosymbiont of Galathealinum brachiosum TaxID=2200906 RepID=A0A370DDE7_9GAMM|nr:MAG: hypothetical protein DIZ80_11765 [endosymbiont of Galathealinum brachiosum]